MIWFALALVGCKAPEATWTGPGARDLIVLSIDTTRRDRIGRYANDGVERSPFLDALLAESTTLDRHRQCSNWTTASMLCTVTGLYLEDNVFFERLDPLVPVPPGQATLAVRLGEAGFTSVLATANGFYSANTGVTQGYDVEIHRQEKSAKRIGRLGIDALEDELGRLRPPERWFLHLHLMEPHWPYLAPAQWLGDTSGLPELPWDLTTEEGQADARAAWSRVPDEDQAAIAAWESAVYEAEIRYVDAQLAGIWAELDGRGWLDEALVVVWTDHGEAFWEHGYSAHANTLAQEETAAVAAFWERGADPVAWDEPTTAADILPTILDRLALPVPDDVSGLPLGTAPPDRPIFAATDALAGAFQSVEQSGWRLTYWWEGHQRLYDLEADPAELVDLAPRQPEKVAELWALLEPQTARMDALIPDQTPTPP